VQRVAIYRSAGALARWLEQRAKSSSDNESRNLRISRQKQTTFPIAKKSLQKNITNPEINEIYGKAISLGAYGGKLLGAGAGGFLLIFARPELHEKIRQKLSPLITVPVAFDYIGTRIALYDFES
jgi:mevalonate kinase